MIQVPSNINPADSINNVVKDVVATVQEGKADELLQDILSWGVDIGKSILLAIVLYLVGHFLIKLINKFVAKMLGKRNMDPGIKSFVKSFVNIILTLMLVIAVIGALGVDTTSFAALLASAGVAIGMALSGNLQNFAGGIIILIFRPFKIGDYIEAQGVAGTVKEIQIFHTIITTPDNKEIYIPNGSLSSGSVVNYSHNGTRRLDFTIGVDYGEDIDKVRRVLMEIAKKDSLIEQTPEPQVLVDNLASSSVDVLLRVWVKNENYWGLYYGMRETIYNAFNKAGINFPYPHLTINSSDNGSSGAVRS